MLSFLSSVEFGITAEDRAACAREFAYIEACGARVDELREGTMAAAELCRKFHALFLALHKKVDTAEAQYAQLGSAVARLRALANAHAGMADAAEAALAKMRRVEAVCRQREQKEVVE